MKCYQILLAIILMASIVSCTTASTAVPTLTITMFATSLPTATATPTPMPTNTPTPTLPPIAATAWASDASGKVNPQMMYPLVGAINYKHRKTIDLVYGNVFLAIATDQDLTKISADEQKNLRAKLAVSLNQSQEFQKLLSKVSTDLSRPNTVGTKFIIIVEGSKPIQALAQQTDIARYSIDQNGTLAQLDTRYQLLATLGVKGKDIVRTDTNEVIKLKGFDMMSSLTGEGKDLFSRTLEYIDIAKKMGANTLRIEYTAAFIASRTDQIRKIVEQAEKNGMYVIFTAASLTGVYADLICPNDEMISIEVELVKLVHPYNNAFLDIYNEPHDVDDPTLGKSIENAVGRITRDGNYKGLIFIPGNDWGRHTRYALNSEVLNRNPNIVYRINVSLAIGDKKYQTPQIIDQELSRATEFLDLAQSNNKPILIGEFALVQDEMKQGPLEKRWQDKVFEYINQYDLNYTQFQLNYYGKGGLLIGTNPRDYKLSQGGEIIFNDLRANPPTQFDK